MRVTLFIDPCAKARPRVTTRGTYMPPAYTAWRKDFALKWNQTVPKITPFDCDLIINTTFFTTTGKMRPDPDNAYAAVLDALQKDVGVIVNDKSVTRGTFALFKCFDASSNHIVIDITPRDRALELATYISQLSSKTES